MTEAAISFLSVLRTNTTAFHNSLEQLPISSTILSNNVTIRDYRDYLIILYGYVKGFEETVYPQIQHIIKDVENRRKASLLLQDLQSLGCEPGEIQFFDHNFLKSNESMFTALGCMYVLEGSTLGGELISRHLEKTLGESVMGSLKYLRVYSTKIGSMWKAFLNAFCESTVTSGQQDEAIKGAVATFQNLEKWMMEQSNSLSITKY